MKFLMTAILTTFLLLSGCSSNDSLKNIQPNNKTSLRINIGEDPSTLDPRKSRSLCDRTIVNMLFEGLTRINKEEKAEPALAQVIEVSSDMMVYTFYLRNAKWSNGETIKASDFLYSWKKILDPKFFSPNAFQLYSIKNAKSIKQGDLPLNELGVEILDEQTIRVYLENPTPYFLELTAFPAFFPYCESADKYNVEKLDKEETIVCCGPFKLKKWKHSDELVVVKNETYWDSASVKLSEIVMCMVKEDTELRMFEKQELDWLGSPLSNIPVDSLNSFHEGSMLKSKPMLGTYFLRLNTVNKVLKNTKIRQALAISIDRKSIVDHILQGNQSPATGLVPTSMGLQNTPYFQDHDVEEAKVLFKKGLLEEGIAVNDFQDISMIFPSGEKNYLIAQALQQQWFESLGIHITIRSVEKKVYFDMLSKQNFDIAAGSWVADFNDPINFLEVFKYRNASTNNTFWEDKQYIHKLEESSAQADPDERKFILAHCEDLLIKQMPIIPVFHYNMLFASHSYLKDMMLSSLGNLDFKWAYLDNRTDTVTEDKL